MGCAWNGSGMDRPAPRRRWAARTALILTAMLASLSVASEVRQFGVVWGVPPAGEARFHFVRSCLAYDCDRCVSCADTGQSPPAFFCTSFMVWSNYYSRWIPAVHRYKGPRSGTVTMSEVGVSVPLLPCAAICAAAFMFLRHRWRLRGTCVHCGYDLSDLTTTACPECGHSVTLDGPCASSTFPHA
jgi:hypothetical protein